MSSDIFPLQEISIRDLFLTSEYCYEIPVYQRNYAWEQDEIKTLLQDIYDKYDNNKRATYYIGTLVSYRRGTDVYEVIDGQQRLTTIRIILGVLYDLQKLDVQMKSRLTFKAREKSDAAIQNIPCSRNDKRNSVKIGSNTINQGFYYAKEKLEELIGNLNSNTASFVEFLLDKVHIIHYLVPSDIDLNHYFEIMNSRGKQLEKHEIIKAKIIKIFSDNNEQRSAVNEIWNACSRMNHYIQSILHKNNKSCATAIFGTTLEDCKFNDIIKNVAECIKHDNNITLLSPVSLKNILKNKNKLNFLDNKNKTYETDRFFSIIDFPNFLLIVLKITIYKSNAPYSVSLDDKDLIKEFDKFLFNDRPNADVLKKRTEQFLSNLVQAKYFLDNFIVHHDFEKGNERSNPWVLQKNVMRNNESENINLSGDPKLQDELCQLLSMFEVTYSSRQRKNYLFYCLYYLINNYNTKNQEALKDYLRFLQNLAYYYFNYFYLTDVNDNQNETDDYQPARWLPINFDDCILDVLEKLADETFRDQYKPRSPVDFKTIYGDGCTGASNSENYVKIPLFIFNYLDYKIWKLYVTSRSLGSDKNRFYEFVCSSKTSTKVFFERFRRFQFSNTRKSLEHFLPQTNVNADQVDDYTTVINCLGNYAMIGSKANSSGSNWNPKTKVTHYLDDSQKIDPISVSSLKFLIMMEICQQKNIWEKDQIQEHQKVMLQILFEQSGLPGETS